MNNAQKAFNKYILNKWIKIIKRDTMGKESFLVNWAYIILEWKRTTTTKIREEIRMVLTHFKCLD